MFPRKNYRSNPANWWLFVASAAAAFRVMARSAILAKTCVVAVLQCTA